MALVTVLPTSLLERAGQIGEADDGGADDGDSGADEEAPVDRRQASAVARAWVRHEDADDGRDDTDHRDRQREHQALGAERLLAQDQRGNQRDGIGLEEVSGHTGAVADVVTDVVSDRRGVTRVVLGDSGLDLADEVSADVSSLGEDAAADPHEHGEQSRAEAEALQHLGGVLLEDQHDDGGAEQTEADRQHADSAASAEGDTHRALLALVLGGRGDADVASHREAHARRSRP